MARFLRTLSAALVSPFTVVLIYGVGIAFSVAWLVFSLAVMEAFATGFVWWMAAILFLWSILGMVGVFVKLGLYFYKLNELRKLRAQAMRDQAQRQANTTAGVEAFSKLKPDLNFLNNL